MNNIEEIVVQEQKDENGKLIRTISTKNGIPHGETVIYDVDGNISCKVNYENGVLSGTAEFFMNGAPLMYTAFKDGQQEGEAIFFTNGVKTATAFFKNGLFNGDFTSFDTEGHIIRVTEYVDGKQHGSCQVFYPDGTILEQSTYKNGKLDGEFVRCFPNGNVMEISTYSDGKQYGNLDKNDIKGNLETKTEV